jgi:hypothetical protein
VAFSGFGDFPADDLRDFNEARSYTGVLIQAYSRLICEALS